MAIANFSSYIAILLTTLITLKYAGPYFIINLGYEAKKGTGVVSFPLTAGPQQLPITRRDDYVDVQLYNYLSVPAYFIELSIGDPPQNLKLPIDTSLSSLWVSVACDTDSTDSSCDPSYGNYDPVLSSTSSFPLGNGTLNYDDGSFVELDYCVDMYSLSTGITVDGLEFGVANYSDRYNGVLGLGFPEPDDQSRTIIAYFASQRIINSQAFSLVLSNPSTIDSGVVIFGGIDTKKFSGSLSVNQIDTEEYDDYTINMEWVGVGTLGDDSVMNLTASGTMVTISSGFGGSYLPNSTLEALSEYFDAHVNSNGRYELPCSVAVNRSSFISFSFANVAIQIPFSTFVLQVEDDLCEWTLRSNAETNGNSILGIQFLQYAYTVFDQTTMTVSLAQYVNCGTHVQEIQSYGVDNVVGECPHVSGVTPASNSSSTPSNSRPDPPSSPTPSLSSGAKVGIGVGVGVGVIAAAALIYFMLVARRRRQANTVRESQNLPPYEPYPDKVEQPRPGEVLHEMHAEQDAPHPIASTHQTLVNEAPGSLQNEQTGYTSRQSTKWAGHDYPTIDGAREADITPHEIGEHPRGEA